MILGRKGKRIKMVILLIENESDLREALADNFEEMGFECHMACDGEQGLRMLALHPKIDVILCDIEMPIMGGLEFTKRARFHFPSLPIFLMTGNSGYSLALARSAGVTNLLSKPNIDIDQVVRAAKNWPETVNDNLEFF